MREIGAALMLSIVVLAPTANAKTNATCESQLTQEDTKSKLTVDNVRQDFVIKGDYSIGFSRIEQIEPSKREAQKIIELAKSSKSTYLILKSVFQKISELYDTHKIEDVISIISIAIQNKIQPVQLASILGQVQQNVKLIENQLGFSDHTQPKFSKSSLQETIMIMNLVNSRRKADGSADSFVEDVQLISSTLETANSLEILLLMKTAEQFEMTISEAIEKIREIQSVLKFDKRHMGFSVDPLNIQTVQASIDDSITVLSIITHIGLSIEDLKAGFQEYANSLEFPHTSDFVDMLSTNANEYLEAQAEAEAQEKVQAELEKKQEAKDKE